MSKVSSSKKSSFDARKMWWIFAAVSSLVVAALAFGIMSAVTATEKYYVLKENVPARTEILPGMLEEIVVQAGSTPPNSLSLRDLEMGDQYALVDLEAGDTLTPSTVGPIAPLTAGIPDDFVVASFVAEPSLAAAGNVKRGSYIDIILLNRGDVPNAEQGATYAMTRVLVIETATSLDSETSTPVNSETGQTAEASAESARLSGIPAIYTVGVSQEDAVKLAALSEFSLYIVLSSVDTVEDDSASEVNITYTIERIWSEPASNAGKGTDSTFTAKGESSDSETEEPSAPSAPSAPEDSQDEAVVEEETVEEPVQE